MKGKQEYDTKPGYFPYCRTHNRLYIHAISLWLTPARPQDLQSFQAICDICKGAISCSSVRISASSIVHGAKGN